MARLTVSCRLSTAACAWCKAQGTRFRAGNLGMPYGTAVSRRTGWQPPLWSLGKAPTGKEGAPPSGTHQRKKSLLTLYGYDRPSASWLACFLSPRLALVPEARLPPQVSLSGAPVRYHFARRLCQVKPVPTEKALRHPARLALCDDAQHPCILYFLG